MSPPQWSKVRGEFFLCDFIYSEFQNRPNQSAVIGSQGQDYGGREVTTRGHQSRVPVNSDLIGMLAQGLFAIGGISSRASFCVCAHVCAVHLKVHFERKKEGDFPGGSVVNTALPVQGVRVWLGN